MNNTSWIVQVLQCPHEDCGSYTPLSDMDQRGVLKCCGCGREFELYEKEDEADEDE